MDNNQNNNQIINQPVPQTQQVQQSTGGPVYTGVVEKPNVVVIGNSGVGKSTLINSLFQSYVAETSIGEATTKQLRVYESEGLGFRIIDTIGFEPGLLNQSKAISAIRKWSRDSIKNDDATHQINMIWYCIDGTSRKMFISICWRMQPLFGRAFR